MNSSNDEEDLCTRMAVVEHHLKHLMKDCAQKADRLELSELDKRMKNMESGLAKIGTESKEVPELSQRMRKMESGMRDFAAHVVKYQEEQSKIFSKEFQKWSVKPVQQMDKLQFEFHDMAQKAILDAAEKIVREVKVGSRFHLVSAKPLEDITSQSTASTASNSEDLETHTELKRLVEEARKDIDVIYSDLRVQMTASHARFAALENGLHSLQKSSWQSSCKDFVTSELRSLSPKRLRSPSPVASAEIDGEVDNRLQHFASAVKKSFPLQTLISQTWDPSHGKARNEPPLHAESEEKVREDSPEKSQKKTQVLEPQRCQIPAVVLQESTSDVFATGAFDNSVFHPNLAEFAAKVGSLLDEAGLMKEKRKADPSPMPAAQEEQRKPNQAQMQAAQEAQSRQLEARLQAELASKRSVLEIAQMMVAESTKKEKALQQAGTSQAIQHAGPSQGREPSGSLPRASQSPCREPSGSLPRASQGKIWLTSEGIKADDLVLREPSGSLPRAVHPSRGTSIDEITRGMLARPACSPREASGSVPKARDSNSPVRYRDLAGNFSTRSGRGPGNLTARQHSIQLLPATGAMSPEVARLVSCEVRATSRPPESTTPKAPTRPPEPYPTASSSRVQMRCASRTSLKI